MLPYLSLIIGLALVLIGLRRTREPQVQEQQAAVEPIDHHLMTEIPVAENQITETKSIETAVTEPPKPAEDSSVLLLVLLGMLQEKGRFVDFVMEDISRTPDHQLAAAARIVHAGCAEVIKKLFLIEHVEETAEGAQVTVPEGYNAERLRLLGEISGEPPYLGTLLHRGWKGKAVNLPELFARPKNEDQYVLMPAEVEVGL